MGKNPPTPPPAPDPRLMANAQANANKEAVRESAKVNAINQITPFGTITYERDAHGVPVAQITQLAPTAQTQLDNQNQLATALSHAALQRISDLPQNAFTTQNLPSLAGNGDDSLSAIENAVYQRMTALIKPEFAGARQSLEQTIADRGLPSNGQFATKARNRLEQSQHHALEQAALAAVLARGTEQDRQYHLAQSKRHNALQEALLERNQPFNEIAAFVQGAPSIQTPTATPLPQYHVAAPDILASTALQQQNLNNRYNQQLAHQQAQMNGLLNLGNLALKTATVF